MTQTDNSAQPHALSRPARVAWLLLILATLYICYFHNLGAIGLVGPDEPRYAWIARAMTETGDWVTPRLYGKPWFEKPVLYYWGAALSFKLFGVSEVTARLPSAISALLATLALAWLALRLYGAETARWLLLLLPTTVGMIGFSHAAATDMPFAAMLTIAMVFAARLLGLVPKDEVKEVKEVEEVKEVKDSEKSDRQQAPAAAMALSSSSTSFISSTSFTSFLFGFFLGLAVLAKGPAAVILSGGAVLLWAIFTKRWRDAFRCLHPATIASFCLTALPWYILCARRNPDFFRVFIIEHNFKRYLTPEFRHIQPFWFYVPILLLAIFPWTIAVIRIFATRSRLDVVPHQKLFFASWIVFPLLFFTISKSKLPGYILPAVLPLALLLTNALLGPLRKNSQRLLLLGIATSLIGPGIVFRLFALELPNHTDTIPSNEVMLISHTAIVAGIVVALLGFRAGYRVSLFAAVISVLLLCLVIDRWLEKIDPQITARPALIEASRCWQSFSIKATSTWGLRRGLFYQLNFYNRAELPEWQPSQPKPEWLLVEPRLEPQVQALGFSCPQYLVYPAVIACRSATSSGRP